MLEKTTYGMQDIKKSTQKGGYNESKRDNQK